MLKKAAPAQNVNGGPRKQRRYQVVENQRQNTNESLYATEESENHRLQANTEGMSNGHARSNFSSLDDQLSHYLSQRD